MKEVFEGSLWEAEVIKGQLNAEGVPCMLRDETLGTVTSPYFTVGGTVKVIVNDEDYANARMIVKSR